MNLKKIKFPAIKLSLKKKKSFFFKESMMNSSREKSAAAVTKDGKCAAVESLSEPNERSDS